MSSGIDYTTIERAIAAWVRGATGLAASRVLWADGNEHPEGAGPWISMDLPGLERIGQDWTDKELSPEPVTPGEEITYKVRGHRELVLTLQCFNGARSGSGRGSALLDDVVAAAAEPAQRRALVAAGIGIGEVSQVQTLGSIRGSTRWEPRAQVQINLHVAREHTKKGTNVVRVQVTGYVPSEADPDVTIALDVNAA